MFLEDQLNMVKRFIHQTSYFRPHLLKGKREKKIIIFRSKCILAWEGPYSAVSLPSDSPSLQHIPQSSTYCTQCTFCNDDIWLQVLLVSHESSAVCIYVFGDVDHYNEMARYYLFSRVAESARSSECASSIAQDLADSKDPKHMLFCREIAFVAIYALFKG